jgi:hypothetical protein
MKSPSVEDFEEGYESEDTLNTRRSDSISKSKDPLAKIDAKIERLKKLPPKRDFTYFMHIGLNGMGINPHRLKVG